MAAVRRVALGLLREWEQGGAFMADAIDHAVRSGKLDQRDRGQIQQLLYAVLRNQTLLDHFVKQLADGKLDPKTRRILRLGFAEALLLDSAPHALVNETVKLAQGWSRKIVNAILRRALDEKERLLASVENLDPEIKWSTPRWLWKRWVKQFGEADTVELCRWNNQPAPVYLRLNPLKPAPSESDAVCESEFPGFHKVIGDLPKEWFENGHAYAQDPSTAAAIELLDLKPGLKVLDACAAPGGKTFAIACAIENEGRIVAADRDTKRVDRMRKNLDRLGVKIAETRVVDWLEDQIDDSETFDRILIDAPCSNTGVMQRRIDVRWRLEKSEFERLQQLQASLLERLAARLKPGGRLVYSTCSIDAEENQQLLDSANHGLQVIEFEAQLPWIKGHDGAFAGALVRQ